MKKQVTVKYKKFKRDKLGLPEFTEYKVDSGVYVGETDNLIELRRSDGYQLIVHKSLILEIFENNNQTSFTW